MLILAVDSATPCAGVALVEENKVLYEELMNYKKTHSETLMPMIDRALATCECSLDNVDAIAITVGPGSFTGLRIGMGTVKGLSLATGKPIVPVSTLETLANNLAGTLGIVGVLLDARKQEVYSCLYDVRGSYPISLSEELALSPEHFVEMVREMQRGHDFKEVRLLGNGFYPYQAYFKEALGELLLEVPSHLMLPRAAVLGNLAINKIKRQEYADVYALRPVYLRLSEAEYRLKRGEL